MTLGSKATAALALHRFGLGPRAGQIAAIAHVNELILVTFNDADFRQFQGLRVLSWR